MSNYREEFPDFDFEVPAELANWSFEDISWRNDTCPSFECDVFVLFIDYTDPSKREFDNGPQFAMHCEGHPYLETDSWDDVVAFVKEGRRDFEPYPYRELVL